MTNHEHFNKGVVFGRLSDLNLEESVTTQRKYLRMMLECPNDLHGDVKVYGRLWGDDRVEELFKELNKEAKLMKGTGLRLEGFFSQYDGEEGQRLNNFTWFKWRLFEGSEYRAAFILTGQIESIDKVEDGDRRLHLHISRQGVKERIEEDFVLFSEDEAKVAELSQDMIVHVKGLLSQKGSEDYFGGSSGVFKAYIKEIKPVKEKVHEPG